MTSPPGRTASGELDRQLLAIPAATYVPALTGCQPNRAGKVCCPFHDDHTTSLQLYDDGGWYCFACRVGGSIYDFAALLFQFKTRGHQFLELRERLVRELATVATEAARTRNVRGPLGAYERPLGLGGRQFPV